MDAKNSMLCKPVLQKTLDDTKQGSTLKRSELQVQPPFKKCRVRHQKECNLWEDLDSNILGDIFSRIPVWDVFLSVSSVCQSWEAACWDYLFWSRDVLDLSITGAGVGRVDISDVVSLVLFKYDPVPGIFGQLDSKHNNEMVTSCLLRKLRRIMEGQNIISRYPAPLQSWRDSIRTIILPYEFGITDAHLLYIAERTPCLERLFLMCPSKITVSGFTRAIQKWKHVNEIHIGPLNNDNDLFMHFIQEIGRNCQELVTLHIHEEGFRVDAKNAQMIAKRLPGLKEIGFQLGHVRPCGITTLYNMYGLQMEEVYIDSCQMKPYVEVPEELEQFFPKVDGFFRLTWTVVDDSSRGGFPKWEVEPNPIKIEDYAKAFQSLGLHKKYNLEDMLTPEFFKEKKIRYQSEFEEWILFA